MRKRDSAGRRESRRVHRPETAPGLLSEGEQRFPFGAGFTRFGYGPIYAVSVHIDHLSRERIHPVFLLDEAHLLHQDTLEHLHVLLKYEWDSRALLSLILVGLPELQDRLELRKSRSLYSRIHRRLSIGPLTPDDTAEYIRMRLRRIGCERDLFASEALATLHEAAGSSLREIDRIATAALREAARRKKRLVERDVLARVVGDPPSRRRLSTPHVASLHGVSNPSLCWRLLLTAQWPLCRGDLDASPDGPSCLAAPWCNGWRGRLR